MCDNIYKKNIMIHKNMFINIINKKCKNISKEHVSCDKVKICKDNSIIEITYKNIYSDSIKKLLKNINIYIEIINGPDNVMYCSKIIYNIKMSQTKNLRTVITQLHDKNVNREQVKNRIDYNNGAIKYLPYKYDRNNYIIKAVPLYFPDGDTILHHLAKNINIDVYTIKYCITMYFQHGCGILPNNSSIYPVDVLNIKDVNYDEKFKILSHFGYNEEITTHYSNWYKFRVTNILSDEILKQKANNILSIIIDKKYYDLIPLLCSIARNGNLTKPFWYVLVMLEFFENYDIQVLQDILDNKFNDDNIKNYILKYINYSIGKELQQITKSKNDLLWVIAIFKIGEYCNQLKINNLGEDYKEYDHIPSANIRKKLITLRNTIKWTSISNVKYNNIKIYKDKIFNINDINEILKICNNNSLKVVGNKKLNRDINNMSPKDLAFHKSNYIYKKLLYYMNIKHDFIMSDNNVDVEMLTNIARDTNLTMIYWYFIRLFNSKYHNNSVGDEKKYIRNIIEHLNIFLLNHSEDTILCGIIQFLKNKKDVLDIIIHDADCNIQ